jgi:hypothetical protein
MNYGRYWYVIIVCEGEHSLRKEWLNMSMQMTYCFLSLIYSWQDPEDVAHFLVCPRRAGYHRVRQFG